MRLVCDYYVIPPTSCSPVHRRAVAKRLRGSSHLSVFTFHLSPFLHKLDGIPSRVSRLPIPLSYGLPANTFSYLLKSPQKFIPTSFLPENQSSMLNYVVWHFLHFVHFGAFSKVPKVYKMYKVPHVYYIFRVRFLRFKVLFITASQVRVGAIANICPWN